MSSDKKVAYLEDKANRIRLKSLEMTTKAGSGHPTTSMSAAEILSVLYFDQMVFDPKNPNSLEGDDFVLSKGHGSPGLYAAMEEAGMLGGRSVMELRDFDSPLEGHPVPRVPGVRLATGSLGQGLSGGIGLARAMKLDKIDRYAYVLLGDGETAEGNVWEAINLAPYMDVDNLIGIIDVNRLGQSDPTVFEWDTDSYHRKLEAFGWHSQVVDGHSVEELLDALEKARKDSRPSMIVAKTVKGKGVDFLENADGRHGAAVSDEELKRAREQLEPLISEIDYTPQNHVELAPMPSFVDGGGDISTDYKVGDKEATRTAYGKALQKLGAQDERIVALDGDVKNSTRTKFFFGDYPERSIECYIAEQNMIGIAMGLQARGKRAHAATFAAFLTRAHDQIRMAAYSNADLKLSGSHTGVSIGEDGPSQMGLEDDAMMRAVFDAVVLSPADAVSAEKLVGRMNRRHGISYMRTIRGKTPILYENDETFDIGGSKVHGEQSGNVGAIVAAGITVPHALDAQKQLAREGINVTVVDAYSIKPLDQATLERIAREARFMIVAEDHYPEGGLGEAVAAAVSGSVPVYNRAVTKLPHSGDPGRLMSEQGIDAESIAAAVREVARQHAKR